MPPGSSRSSTASHPGLVAELDGRVAGSSDPRASSPLTWYQGRPLGPLCYDVLHMREQVGVRELRQNLSVHLRRVRTGATLEVTDHGRPVAILAPLPEHSTPMQRLIASGLVLRPATKRLVDLPPPIRVPRRFRDELRRALEEQREDRI